MQVSSKKVFEIVVVDQPHYNVHYGFCHTNPKELTNRTDQHYLPRVASGITIQSTW